MGRPKGSKNKPKANTLEPILDESPKEIFRHNTLKDDVWYIYETPHRGNRYLVTYTVLGEKAAKKFIKSIEDFRPKSIFDVEVHKGTSHLRKS